MTGYLPQMTQAPGMMQAPGMAPGMMQAPGMAPGMMQTPGVMQAPGAYGFPSLPPSGLVNLDVDSAPGCATLDTSYPLQFGFPGAGMVGTQEFAPARPAVHPSYAGQTYTVKRGDTVYKIAKRFGTTMNAVVQANNLSNPHLIYPGQVLYIP